jgi:hypothetical protein
MGRDFAAAAAVGKAKIGKDKDPFGTQEKKYIMSFARAGLADRRRIRPVGMRPFVILIPL